MSLFKNLKDKIKHKDDDDYYYDDGYYDDDYDDYDDDGGYYDDDYDNDYQTDDNYQSDGQTSPNNGANNQSQHQYVDLGNNRQQEDEDNYDYDDDGYNHEFAQQATYINGSDQFSAKDVEEFDKQKKAPTTILGQPSLINMIAPSFWSDDNEFQDEFVMRENLAHRTYGVVVYVPQSGWPRALDTSIFEEILSEKDVDLTLDVVPRSRQESMKDLNNMLNVIRANAMFQQEKGQTFQLRENVAKYNDINNFLDQIQFDENRDYDVSLSMIIYGSTERELRSNLDRISDIMANKGLSLTPYTKRVKSGYFQALPIGARLYNLDDTYRNIDRRALSVMDIARNASGRFNGGIPVGINLAVPSRSTEYINLFGNSNHRPINYNFGIVGETGSGKSLFAKLFVARSVSILGQQVRSIDPENEYIDMTRNLGGLNINITSTTNYIINPCRISTTETPLEEITMTNESGKNMTPKEVEEVLSVQKGNKIITHEDGSKYIQRTNINAMIDNVTRFINVILTSFTHNSEDGLTPGEARRIEDALKSLINDKKITVDPDSLYYKNKSGYVGKIFYSSMPKPEITLTDLYNRLKEKNTNAKGEEDPQVSRLLDALSPYLRTGTKPMFDGQTFFGEGRSTSLNDFKYVNFSIGDLEGSLKTVAYFVLTQYLWEDWINNPSMALEKKLLVLDEIIQYIDDPMMAEFIEKMARRDRKRNAGLIWITQDIDRFQANQQAKALVTSSEHMFILKTKPEHRELMKQTMDLPDGAMDILCGNPDKGEGILRVEGESVLIRSNPTDADWKFVESNRAVGQEKKDAQGVIDEINDSLM